MRIQNEIVVDLTQHLRAKERSKLVTQGNYLAKALSAFFSYTYTYGSGCRSYETTRLLYSRRG